MNKVDVIMRYGKAAWEKELQRAREYQAAHREEAKARVKAWTEVHPEEAKAHHQEANRKGGKRYEKRRAHQMQGIPHKKEIIRCKHQRTWTLYKRIIAPLSQIHHEWFPGTADYRGVALVEANQHRYGIIDVIQILDGEITLLTEEGIKKR